MRMSNIFTSCSPNDFSKTTNETLKPLKLLHTESKEDKLWCFEIPFQSLKETLAFSLSLFFLNLRIVAIFDA